METNCREKLAQEQIIFFLEKTRLYFLLRIIYYRYFTFS